MGISKKSWTGLVFETTPGTAVLTPTVYHPCKSKFQQKKKFIYLSEDRGSRDGNTKRKASVRSATGDISGTFYLDTSPYLLKAFMGSITTTTPDTTNAPTGRLHTFALTDTPPSLTVLKGYDVAGYYFSYSVVNKLKYQWSADGKLLEENAGIEARYGTQLTAPQFSTVNTPTYSSDTTPGGGTIFAGYTPTIQLDGVSSTNVEEMSIELDQKVTLFYAINGSQDFVKVYFGDRTAKIDFTASFDDTTLYSKFDAETDQHINVAFKGNKIGTGASTVFEGLTFDFPIVGYDDAEMDVSKEYIQLKVKGTARPGTTLNSLFGATVTNTVASYVN